MEDEHVSGIFSCLQCSCCPCVHESSVLAYDPVESPPCWLGKSGGVEGGIFLPPPLPHPPFTPRLASPLLSRTLFRLSLSLF